jgi:hypothetical protein
MIVIVIDVGAFFSQSMNMDSSPTLTGDHRIAGV